MLIARPTLVFFVHLAQRHRRKHYNLCKQLIFLEIRCGKLCNLTLRKRTINPASPLLTNVHTPHQ